MIVTVPWVADPSRFKPDPQGGEFALFLAVISGLTLSDWKWNAEQFNKVGEQVKKAGLQLGYHNHNFEWTEYDGVTAYDEFLRLTDPGLVKLELDCGWATVAGQIRLHTWRNIRTAIACCTSRIFRKALRHARR
jgi:sugar phosphate isomerase/epimerase